MFSKPLFKQNIQVNWKLSLIITIVASVILAGFIVNYDAAGYGSIAAAAEGTAFSNILSSMTSLLGSLENFYKLIAVILGIVYVVFTANNLVVNEVDSGSMAYTLSTPIKRSSVIFTKSLYLILSVILMYSVIGLVGLAASQITYQNVTGYPITDDIRAASNALNLDERYISERLYLIQEDKQAMREAAVARDMDTEAYSIYLESIIRDRSYEATATIITDERFDFYEDTNDIEGDEIEITVEELVANPAMILSSNEALNVGAKIHGISVNDYHQFISEEIIALDENLAPELARTETVMNRAAAETSQDSEAQEQMQDKRQLPVIVTEDNAKLLLQMVIDSSADALKINAEQVSENMTLMKDPIALEAATDATGLSEAQVINMANHGMVSSARSVDIALEFDLEVYLWLMLGLLLTILAMSSISFLASTFFNRTGFALAVGGGIPFAFFLITMVQQLMDSPGALKYLTLTSLFDTEAILSGGDFGWGLIALGAIALILYIASNIIFVKKDLPL